MRINEAYEHEPIVPYMTEDAARQNGGCDRAGGCDRTSSQCVDVSAPITLTPRAVVGTVVVTCQGSPSVTCTTNPSGTSCSVVLTQRVCVSIPVRYSVELAPGEAAIACAGDGTATGCCCS